MAKTESPKSDSQRYARGPLPGAKALSAVMKRIAGPDLRRKGFFESGLAAEWPAIVGTYLAERCAPEKLRWPRGPEVVLFRALVVVAKAGFEPAAFGL